MTESWAEMETVLRDATESLREAEQRESFVRGEVCTARNRLNDIQKKIDAYVAELRKLAPRDSAWARQRSDEITANREIR